MTEKLLPFLLVVPLLSGCSSPNDDKIAAGPGGPGMPPPEVAVTQVNRSQATITAELPGRVAAVRTAQVRARVEGIVEKRLFAEGSDVRAGQTLFRLDDRTYRTAAKAAEADLAVKRQNLSRLESVLHLKAVSQQDVDLARAQVKQAEAQLARARLDLENTTVPAPISGRIGRALVTEGALVGRDDATLMAIIEQLDPVHVLFTQPNAEVLRLRNALATGRLKPSEENSLEVVLEDGRVYPHRGRLLMSEMSVDPNTGNITLKAEFPNPERLLLPGTFVRVRYAQAVAVDVIAVPQSAVLSGPQGQYVLLVGPDDKVLAQAVRVGPMSGAHFIIESGLSGGERLIVSGLQKARPDSVVKPVPMAQVIPPDAPPKR